LQIQDGGGRHLKKSENSHILAAVPPILTKFGTVMQFDTFDRPDRLNFKFSKIQDGGDRHLENSKNRPISAAVQPIFTKFGMLVLFYPLTVTAVNN